MKERIKRKHEGKNREKTWWKEVRVNKKERMERKHEGKNGEKTWRKEVRESKILRQIILSVDIFTTSWHVLSSYSAQFWHTSRSF